MLFMFHYYAVHKLYYWFWFFSEHYNVQTMEQTVGFLALWYCFRLDYINSLFRVFKSKIIPSAIFSFVSSKFIQKYDIHDRKQKWCRTTVLNYMIKVAHHIAVGTSFLTLTTATDCSSSPGSPSANQSLITQRDKTQARLFTTNAHNPYGKT